MRIKDKINELECYLSELGEIIPEEFSGYINDLKTKAACDNSFFE